MYVICAGMYRACSTWQYDVIAQILERHRQGSRLGYMTGEEFAEYDDVQGRPSDGWRVLKSHEEHPRFRRAVSEGRAAVIYAHRDLRDVVYSLMHKRRLSFNALLAQGMIHQILANDRFWTSRPGVFTQRYENLTRDPTTGITELADRLDVRLADGEAEEIASKFSLEANRRRTLELGRRLREQGVDLADPSNAQYADGETLLHWNHLRDGRTGGWREHAQPRERAILARVVNRWLSDRGYEADQLPRAIEGSPGFTASILDRCLQARGWLACQLRCASLRHPHTARAIKSAIGVAPAPRPHAMRLPISPDTKHASKEASGRSAAA